MKKLSISQHLLKIGGEPAAAGSTRRKRVLVVDDSLTVRELERKVLGHHGYEIEVAVDGMDGWNAVRTGGFDLVVTDIDMPRMDGIELVTQIRHNPNLKGLPVMIVSYKDREEDRRRGLEAGADYYLTKASFNDDALLRAVVDLIGEADA
jgi:two-component system sensor histidine kinase and response regulator WspE